ncbi:MAG: GYF domain-containing protein [Bdellovibrionales bacterium]|nr:GYF domain-containing protein [Bdellovibrionales bacterium]
MSQYYVSHEGQQQGPLSLSEIAEAIKKNKLNLLDYIFDEQKNDWILIMEFSPLKEVIKNHRPPPPPSKNLKKTYEQQPSDEITSPHLSQNTNPHLILPKVEQGQHHQNNENAIEWFILKGENKFGPFTYSDLIKMLQKKSLYEYDFIWHSQMPSWKRVAEISDFQPEQIRKLVNTDSSPNKEIFFRRRFRRMNYNGTILVHDNKNVWKGSGLEISSGGVGVVMENAALVPGQVLYLHFKPGDEVPPFNAICEIVNKQFVDGIKDKNMPIRYGLKFTNISSATQQTLTDLTNKKIGAA